MEEGIKPVFITAEDVPPVKISENAETVLFKRYYRKDESGKPVENAQQMFIRVANAVANADHNQAIVYSLAKDFYEAMTDKFFLPNSPTLMNAGLPDGQLAACFVLPVGDSIPEIFDAVKHAAMIHKSGGGTGFSFSRIRPKNSCVRTTGGVASGPVSFMRIFDTATEQIKQGGCFPAGTLVATADGPVPIEQLREGQLVFSLDLNEGFVLRPCTDAFMTKRNQRIWELTTDKKFSVGSTKDHPYMLRSSGAKNGLKYTKLEDLTPGVALMPLPIFTEPDVQKHQVVSIRDTGRDEDVWNVEVPGTHNFVVCDADMQHGLVVSNTRRGANMGILRVDHPDIFEFIRAKEKEGEITNFNLSVGLTECFMQAVENNTDYALVDPSTGKEVERVPAREVFDLLVEKAWQSGDPGIVFLDRINENNPLPAQGDIEATNPCVSGDTPLFTDKGNLPIAGLVGKTVTAWNGFEWSDVTPEVTGRDQPMLRVTFSEGSTLVCTLYHRFRIHEAGSVVEKQARDLQIGDKLCEWELPRGVCVNGEACLRIVVDDWYVAGIEDAGVCDKVYCAREPKRGTLMFNNVVTMNCGEQPLLPYEACNLGSINLSKFVAISGIDGKPYFDYPRLDVYVRLAVRFLDNVITASVYPLPEIAKTVKRNRKIGLGVMGWADTLFQLGIPYNSDEAVNMAEIVMARIQEYAYRMSEWLAEQRGAFPAFDKSSAGANGEKPLRNATLTTIAPTGTLSIIGECSSGIEPLFALSFTRNVMDGAKLVETNVHFEDALREAGVYSEELMAKVAAQGSVQDMEEIPEHIRKVFVTAADISPEYHLKMQAAFQQYTDNAVSKTVNLPNSATINDVHDIYMMAYKTGCKGVTVYRDGCKASQVLTTGKNAASPAPAAPAAVRVKKRPDVLPGKTFKVRTGLGVLYLTVNEIDGQPFEVFAAIGKSGHSVTAKAEAIGRLVSLALRSGVPVEAVVAQIKGIGGEHPIFQQEGLLLSIPDAVATVLESEYMQNKAKSGVAPLLVESSCPECGAALVFQEGCPRCTACGFSKCG